MLVEDAQPRSPVIELRQQARYWRAQHARTVQREAAAKGEAQQLKQVVRDQQAQVAELTWQLEALQANVAWLRQQVSGRKSEQSQQLADQACDHATDVADGPELSPRSTLTRQAARREGIQSKTSR